MKASAVGIKEGHDVNGRDLSVEGVVIFEVIVPNFINNMVEKLGHTLFGCLVTGVVIKLGFVGSLCTNASNCWAVISNHPVIEWETRHTNLAPWSASYLKALVRMAVRE
jgi:hypothetical protein